LLAYAVSATESVASAANAAALLATDAAEVRKTPSHQMQKMKSEPPQRCFDFRNTLI